MKKRQIIIYDDKCPFCISIIDFVFKKDKKKIFGKLSIHSMEARNIIRELGENFIDLQTVYFINDERIYKRSSAVFQIFSFLPYPWKLMKAFNVLPLPVTDYFYKTVARNRYKWFGKLQ